MLRKLVVAGVLCLSTIVCATEEHLYMTLEDYQRAKGYKSASLRPKADSNGFSLSLLLDNQTVSVPRMEGRLSAKSLLNIGCLLDKLCISFPIEQFNGSLAYVRFHAFSQMLKQGGELVMDALWESRDFGTVKEKMMKNIETQELNQKTLVAFDKFLEKSSEEMVDYLKSSKQLNPFKQFFPSAEFESVSSKTFPDGLILRNYGRQLTAFFESVGFDRLVMDIANNRFTVTKKWS